MQWSSLFLQIFSFLIKYSMFNLHLVKTTVQQENTANDTTSMTC
jgi:hypothetical protein